MIEASEGSDVDVALLLRDRPPATLEGLQLDLEGALERQLERPVQVVVLNVAPADLTHRVLRDGIILLDRDRAARIRFEVQAREAVERWNGVFCRSQRDPLFPSNELAREA